jgi:signal transduction histidine kinase
VENLNILTNLEWENVDLDKTSFDLAKLVEGTAEGFTPAAREKGVEIKLELCPSPITADYNRLKQVFINLLSNAVKYTDSGSITVRIMPILDASIDVSIKGAIGDKWEVTIADTGIGINGEELPRIFERFYRSDKSRTRSTGGAGIGLTIAAAIVKAHGGSIRAESEQGQGSVFKVRI